MGHGGRPSELERPASAKIMSLLPEDGSEMPLTELRKAATIKLHMSPTTLTNALREMVQSMLVRRRVDSTLSSRTYYSRYPLALGSSGKFEGNIQEMGQWLDEWLGAGTALIRLGLASTFVTIVANRDKSLEKAILTSTGYSAFSSVVLKHPWSVISDFQWLVRGMSPEQLKDFIPYVLDVWQHSQDDFTQKRKNLKALLPPWIQENLLDKPPQELDKFWKDRKYQEACISKWKAEARKTK